MARLRVRNEFELQDLVDQLGRAPDLIARDFALMTIAARLTETYADELCFKGGFVLRHVHGHERFSRDIDATRVKPPKHKLDAAEVTAEITRASVGSLVAIRAAAPAIDSGRSLDFERVDFTSPLSDGRVSVEISYREDVLDPRTEQVGPPYYDPFPIAVLSLEEIVAEKLRALCQRTRPTAGDPATLQRATKRPHSCRPAPGFHLQPLRWTPTTTAAAPSVSSPTTSSESPGAWSSCCTRTAQHARAGSSMPRPSPASWASSATGSTSTPARSVASASAARAGDCASTCRPCANGSPKDTAATLPARAGSTAHLAERLALWSCSRST